MFTGATGIDWLAPPKVVILDMMVNQSDGSTYLTGSVFADSSSQKPLGESDILFVKYSDDGSRLFFQQSGTTRFDQGESLAMDSLGYVYVTGVTTGSLDEQVAYGNQDIFLLKYDWMGRKIWTKQYGTAEDDVGKSVAVDPLSQDIFMTGYSYGDLHGEQNEGNSDLFLLKVRSDDGKTLFTKLYGTVGFDGGKDILIDPSYGDIYISGSVDGTLDSQQAFLIKYDRNGTEVWDKYLDPRDVSYAMTMVMDSQHCLYLLGYVHRSFVEYNTVGRSDIVLQTYDEMGKLLYSTSYGSGGEDRGRGAMGMDWPAPPKVVILDMMVNQSDGSTYLTGSVFADSSSQKPLGESDILFVKYSDDGSRLFFQQSGTTRFDQGESLAMDSLGYVYVTGVTTGSLDEQVAYGNQDIFLLKYDWMGRKIWTKQYGTAEDDVGKSVAVDPLSQDIFMTGYSYGDLHGEQNEGNSDLFLLKVRSDDGKTLFTKLYGTVGFDGGKDILIDPSYGDIYISGSVDGTLDSQQAFLIKYDRNGTEVWDKYLDPRDVSYAMTMVMDSQHCLYLLGYVHRSFVEYNTVGRSDIVLQTYDEMGKLLYSTSYGSGGEDRGRGATGMDWPAPPKVVILDMMVNQSDGSTYLTGSVFADSSSQKPLGESDILFVKYSDDGSRLFFQQSGTTRFDQGESLAMDSLGYVYVTGVTTGSLDEQVAYGNQDIFLLKYDWMGRKIWTKQYGTAEDDVGKSVAVDPLSQDIFMTGYSYGDLHGEQNEGNSDLFLLKVRSDDGKTLFTKLYGTVGFDGGKDILIDPSYGDIYISGSVDGTLDSQQAFLIKYDRNGTEVWDKYLDPRDVSYAMTMSKEKGNSLM
eukprot:gene3974-biopygen2004